MRLALVRVPNDEHEQSDRNPKQILHQRIWLDTTPQLLCSGSNDGICAGFAELACAFADGGVVPSLERSRQALELGVVWKLEQEARAFATLGIQRSVFFFRWRGNNRRRSDRFGVFASWIDFSHRVVALCLPH
jgi:hypothetical protein